MRYLLLLLTYLVPFYSFAVEKAGTIYEFEGDLTLIRRAQVVQNIEAGADLISYDYLEVGKGLQIIFPGGGTATFAEGSSFVIRRMNTEGTLVNIILLSGSLLLDNRAAQPEGQTELAAPVVELYLYQYRILSENALFRAGTGMSSMILLVLDGLVQYQRGEDVQYADANVGLVLYNHGPVEFLTRQGRTAVDVFEAWMRESAYSPETEILTLLMEDYRETRNAFFQHLNDLEPFAVQIKQMLSADLRLEIPEKNADMLMFIDNVRSRENDLVRELHKLEYLQGILWQWYEIAQDVQPNRAEGIAGDAVSEYDYLKKQFHSLRYVLQVSFSMN